MSDPPFFLDSTTTTASAIPATMRLRATKLNRSGSVLVVYSVSMPPLSSACTATFRCTAGYILSNPCAGMMMVDMPASMAARCATTSIPYANPLTMVRSGICAARSRTSRLHQSLPRSEGMRVPTILTVCFGLTSTLPLA